MVERGGDGRRVVVARVEEHLVEDVVVLAIILDGDDRDQGRGEGEQQAGYGPHPAGRGFFNVLLMLRVRVRSGLMAVTTKAQTSRAAENRYRNNYANAGRSAIQSFDNPSLEYHAALSIVQERRRIVVKHGFYVLGCESFVQ